MRHVRQVRGGKTNLFYDYIGSDYVELAFQYAYETRAKLQAANSKTNIKLFYNDYNTFATYGANKRDAIIQLVKSVNSFASDGNGGYLKFCDGIGMQSYIGGYGQQSGCMNDNDITLVKNAIEKFAENNVEVHVTELAVRNYDNDASRSMQPFTRNSCRHMWILTRRHRQQERPDRLRAFPFGACLTHHICQRQITATK